MKALAWDDQPDYMLNLKRSLQRHYDIQLEIVHKEGEFIERFLEEDWDFIVVDFLDETYSAPGDEDTRKVGLRLAWKLQEQPKGRALPIFMITNHYDRLELGKLPPNMIPKSKSTHSGWMAGEVYQELVRLGVYVNHRKVFLIFGHDRNADGTTGRVKHFLESSGILVEAISAESLHTQIAQGLLARMNDCGAFVAICTPDDPTQGGPSQPRQNVLLEIGIAMGLSRGPERLVLLQRWGPKAQDQAHLPTDLDGFLTIQFEGRVENQFEVLRQKLKDIGIKFNDQA